MAPEMIPKQWEHASLELLELMISHRIPRYSDGARVRTIGSAGALLLWWYGHRYCHG
jgi:hypothetical protein